MRIPQQIELLTLPEAPRGELFNPILHYSFEDVGEKRDTECKCDSTDPDDFYPNNKSRCKSCVIKRNIEIRKGITIPIKRKREYATCDCGNCGDDKFYFRMYEGKRKILYPCKECKKQSYETRKPF